MNREAFEAWIMRTSPRAGTHVNKDTTGKYLDNRVDAKWSAWQAALASQAQQESHDELTLRRLLCMVYSGNNAYTDDGELQDNAAQPFIDFKRDSAWELQKKLHARVVNSLTKLPPAPEGGEKSSCRQCGAPAGNGHCLGDIWNCSDLAAPEGGK